MSTAATLAPRPSTDALTHLRPARRAGKRRWFVAAGLLVLLYFAPAIVARTSFRDLPLRMVFEGMEGTIKSGGASLGWFSAVEYRDVEVLGLDGEPLVNVPRVTVDRTTLQLLFNRANVGTVTLFEPSFNIVARDGATNAEEILLPWWNTPSSGPVELELHVVDGTVAVKDEVTGDKWEVSSVQATLGVPVDATPITWSVQAKTGDAGLVAASSNSTTAGAIELTAEEIPLSMLRGVLARWQPGLKVDGRLACELSWQSDGASGSALRGKVGLTDLAIAGEPLREDVLRLKDLIVESEVKLAGEQVSVKQLIVDCEAARLTLKGEFPAAWKNQTPIAIALAHSEFELDGSIKLARLAQMLPNTLRVRPDLQITEGGAGCTLASAKSKDGHTWQGRLETVGLAAVRAGQPIRWEKPLVLNVSARETPGGVAVNALECSSDFMYVTGSGTPGQFAAEATVDLDRLKAELGRFFDLQAIELAGEGKLQLQWQRDASGVFQASAAGGVKGLRFGADAASAWREDELTADLQAHGRMKGASVERLDSAVLKLLSINGRNRPDELDLHLREPIAPSSDGQRSALARLPLLLHCNGDVARWRTRLSPWIDLSGWDLTGGMDLHANLTWTSDVCDLHSLKGAVRDLHAWNGQLFIDEPIVRFESAGRYEAASSRVELSAATIESSAASVRAERTSIAFPTAGSLGLLGDVAFVVDLERLQRWTHDPKQPAAIVWTGQLGGRANLTLAGETTTAQVEASISDFAAIAESHTKASGNPGNPLRGAASAGVGRSVLWQEKQLTLAMRGTYSRPQDAVRLDTIEIGSEALRLRAAGQIDELAGAAVMQLTGEADYDWDKLSPLLAPYVGSDVRVQGEEKRRFAVRGPIGELLNPSGNPPGQSNDSLAWLKPLSAEASVGWQMAEAYGMQVGKGEIAAELRDGILRFKPIDLAVSEGRISLSPLVRVTPEPLQLEHGRGKVIDRVRAAPEMTSSWLKYIAPAVADATQTEGQLSVELDGVNVPLFKPATSSLVGRLEVHSLQVTPGAPARAIILLAEQIRALVERRPPPMELGRNPTLLSISDQRVAFRMVDGRVYHEGMKMDVGPVTLRTQGWVALDESIGLVVEIPVKSEWFGGNQAPAGLRDQTLQIPMSGTLRQPKIDPRAWQQVVVLFGQNAAREVIGDQLNKQLDRLFQPK